MGRPLEVTWAEADTAEALHVQYRRETDARLAKRLRALWLVRRGLSLRAAAAVVDADERSFGMWLRWYRSGGVPEVRQHHQAGKGRAAWLSEAQQTALHTHLCSGAVYPAQDAIAWVEERYQITYRPKGMYSLLKRLQARPKVPRPHNPKSTPEQQEAWKKGDSPTPCARPASPLRPG